MTTTTAPTDPELYAAGCLTRHQLKNWTDADLASHAAGVRKTLQLLFDLLAGTRIDAVGFERILSYRPEGHEPCLRDFAFDHYCRVLKDADRANAATRAFTDALFERFVEHGEPA